MDGSNSDLRNMDRNTTSGSQNNETNRGTKRKYPGMTAPISEAAPLPEEIEQTTRLEACLRSYGLFESDEEMSHRVNVLSQVNTIASEWINQVSLERGMPPDTAGQMSGKIFTFGSFRLGVHTKGKSLMILPGHLA